MRASTLTPAWIGPTRQAGPLAEMIDPAVAIAGSVAFALVLFLPQILNDGDTLWQIRTGEWILANLAIPAVDPFSFTAGDKPWFAHEWFAETLLALAFRAGGMSGVMVLAATAVGLTAALLLRHLRRFLPGIYAVLGLIVALANAAPSMLARPHLLAWPCLVLWCGGLVTARANRTAPSYWLLPVMVLWVNLHGSFMVGLLLPGAFMLEALCDPGANHRHTFTTWASFLLAAWAAALINPDVLGGVLFPFHMLGMKSLAWIGEWEPTDFGRIQPLELMILAGLALGLSGKVKLPPMRLLMLLGLIHGALAHGRHEQLLGIVGALILAEPLGESLGRGKAEALAWHRLAAGAGLIALAALVTRVALPLSPARTGAAFAATLDQVPPSLRARPVLNDYSLGGRLIFQGVRPFIDSRADLYGDEFLTRYRRVTWPDRDALDLALSEYGIAWTIFPSGHRIVPVLDRKPDWHRLTEVDGVVIHVREDRTPR
ncbi:MAG: hypothetical protein EXR07_02390 [Acetobacteraceae bacterium]|nr:hypothetical protein [Acetobacteraceae bacterium]